MMSRKVFIVWKHPLFYSSLRLILDDPNIDLVGAASDYETAREEIWRLHPDTILFERTGTGLPVDVMEILQAEPWDMRVIGFSLENNEMSLYHHEHRTIMEAGDLLQFVLG